MDDERERNISQARDIAAYLLELSEHLEHAAGARHSWACCRTAAVGSAADARAVRTTGRRAHRGRATHRHWKAVQNEGNDA
jgi:hypothetical protein